MILNILVLLAGIFAPGGTTSFRQVFGFPQTVYQIRLI